MRKTLASLFLSALVVPLFVGCKDNVADPSVVPVDTTGTTGYAHIVYEGPNATPVDGPYGEIGIADTNGSMLSVIGRGVLGNTGSNSVVWAQVDTTMIHGGMGTAQIAYRTLAFPRPSIISNVGQNFKLASGCSLTQAPIVSPDGSHIAYLQYEPRQDVSLWVQSSQGGSALRISGAVLPSPTPAFSPDGLSIAYYTGPESAGAINIATIDGNPATNRKIVSNLNVGYSDSETFAWSHDGTEIVYRSNGGLYNAGVDMKRMPVLIGRGYAPAWSPVGHTLVYIADEQDLVFTSDNGMTKQKIPGPTPLSVEAWPTWSPDGNKLLFTTWNPASMAPMRAESLEMLDVHSGVRKVVVQNAHRGYWLP